MDQHRLQQRLDELAEKYGLVGVAAGYLDGGDLVAAASGVTSLVTEQPATTDTLFQIGSVTKVYTATLVMQLVDEGRVDLDAPITSYLPGVRFGDEAATRTATVRQFLTHTAGIEGDVFDEFGRGDDAIEQFVGAMRDLPQLHEPGETLSYCNAGWVLLGRLVEVLRDTPFHRALADHLLDPAGLAATVSLPEEVMLRRFAIGHLPDPDDRGTHVPAPIWTLSAASEPAGSLLTATVEDLLRFGGLHVAGGAAPDGTRVLSRETVAAMQEPQVDVPDALMPGLTSWGLGWMVGDWDGHRLVSHDGGTIGQGSMLRVLPDDDLVLALVFNGGRVLGLGDELLAELASSLRSIDVPGRPQPPDTLPPVDVDRFAGTYRRHGVTTTVRAEEGDLVLEVAYEGRLAELAPPSPPATLVPLDADRFLVPGDAADDPMRSLTFYGDDGSGRPVWLHHGARANRRVG